MEIGRTPPENSRTETDLLRIRRPAADDSTAGGSGSTHALPKRRCQQELFRFLRRLRLTMPPPGDRMSGMMSSSARISGYQGKPSTGSLGYLQFHQFRLCPMLHKNSPFRLPYAEMYTGKVLCDYSTGEHRGGRENKKCILGEILQEVSQKELLPAPEAFRRTRFPP